MHEIFRGAIAPLRLLALASRQRQSSSKEWAACASAIKSALASGDYAAALQKIEHCRSTLEPASNVAYLVFLSNAALAYSEAGQFDKSVGIKQEVLELAIEAKKLRGQI